MQVYETIPAGLTHSTILPDMDFETYSEAGFYFYEDRNKWGAPYGTPKSKPGLPSIGAAKYAEHPSTEIISLAYDLKQGAGATLWVAGMPPPKLLLDYLATGGLIEAWNVEFEFRIWEHIAHKRLGWPMLLFKQIRCAMAKAAAWGIPGKLEKAGAALALTKQKFDSGKGLIKQLSCPKNPTKKEPYKRRTPQTHPEKFAEFYVYNLQDIVAEAAVSKVVPDLTPEELELWILDQKINFRGVQVDIESMENCLAVLEQAKEKYTREFHRIIGNVNLTIDQLEEIKKWMGSQGFPVTSLDKEHIEAHLKNKHNPPPPNVRRVLEIRQIMGSASVKKLYALQRYVNDDGRVRGLYAYHGARQTGRFAGRGPQPQNEPAGGPGVVACPNCKKPYYAKLPMCYSCYTPSIDAKPIDWCIEAAELALEHISTRDLSHVEFMWQDPLKAISGSLRALFIAGPGKDLMCSDFSAIEAVCLAAEAGEKWRLEVFRTHGKIYEESASKITGIPFQEFLDFKERTKQHHPMRKKIGKPAELGSGYQGWIQAWKNFGADKFLTDEEIKQGILKWRKASPMIVEYWGGQYRKHPDYWEFTPELHGIEGTVVTAILNPSQSFDYRGITYGVHDDVLYCKLLSGRYLTYHKPRLHNGTNFAGFPCLHITYMGWNSDITKGPVGWMRRNTYGGSLVENITQAVARDIFTFAMVNLDKAGYTVILHSHDEIISEIPQGFGSIEEFEQIMGTNPPWCLDWPIKAAGGWRGYRYRKG